MRHSRLGSSQAASLVGTLIAGTYRVERVLGRGGMGTVYAAMHETLRERVAVKLLQVGARSVDDHDHGDEDAAVNRAHHAEMHARFLLEARVSARFKNEHIARVTDVGTLEDDTPYMVMEFVEGVVLSSLMAQGPMNPRDAVEIATQVCEGLAEAHAQRIVHRDIKPSNIMLAERADGTRLVKILDFGIMKVLDDDVEHTRVEQVLGSPRYIAPEQLNDPATVDARADVWSLGVILYECLLGAPLFPGLAMPEIVAGILSSAPRVRMTQRPPGVTDALALAVCGALVHDPEERTQNVAELASELLEAVHDMDSTSRLERIEHALGHDPSTGAANRARRRALLVEAESRPARRWLVPAALFLLGAIGSGAFLYATRFAKVAAEPTSVPTTSSRVARVEPEPPVASSTPVPSAPVASDASDASDASVNGTKRRPHGHRPASAAPAPPPASDHVVPHSTVRPDPFGERQ